MSVRIESFSTDNSFFFIPIPSNEGITLDEAFPVVGSPSSTRMEFSAVVDGEKRTMVLEGSFSFASGAPKSTFDLTNVTGQLTSLKLFLNNKLFESDTFTPGVSLQQLLDSNSSVTAAQSVYSGDDVFIAAKNPGAQDYGDIVDGFAGNDTFYGHGSGSQYQDVFYGGAGLDTSVFDGPRSSYKIFKTTDVYNAYGSGRLQNYEGYVITNTAGGGGRQEVSKLERLKFTDGTVAIDFYRGDNGYKAAMMIAAAFGKEKINTYFAAAVGLFDGGFSNMGIANLVVDKHLIEDSIGSSTNKAFVNAIYKNVFGGLPSAGDEARFTILLDSGAWTKESLLLVASEFVGLETQINLTGLQNSGIFYPA